MVQGVSISGAPPITIEEVAAQAGVSPGTVSRVLNGKNKENRPAIAERSERIRQLALRLGYRPNAAARSVLSGQFRTLAFVTCGDVGNDWYPISALNGIHATIDPLDWKLLYNELPAHKINNPELVPQLFRESAVDGLIVNLLPAFSEEMVDYFEQQPLPCVWLNLKRALRSVYPDELGGAALAVEWLRGRGHTRIGHLSRVFSVRTHYSAHDRFTGFMTAMEAAGLSPHRHMKFLSQDPGPRPIFKRATEFLKSYPDVQAVLCYEYEEAVSLMLAAERIGRRVPEDLEIIGFHEGEIRSSSGLPIPTVIVPFQEVGKQAVQLLMRIIETRDREVESISVPFTSILI